MQLFSRRSTVLEERPVAAVRSISRRSADQTVLEQNSTRGIERLLQAPICPGCAKMLRPCTLGTIDAHICADCAGIWLKQGSMPAAIRRGPDVLRQITAETGLPVGNISTAAEHSEVFNCPSCGSPMEGGPYAYNLHARVDHCPDCSGTWIGAGELASVITHFTEMREGHR